MLNLKDIIWIKEVEPHVVVEGLTRQRLWPLETFDIAETKYRVNGLEKLGDNYHFVAIIDDGRVLPYLLIIGV